MVEVYAGQANVTFCMRKRGYRAAKLDLLYNDMTNSGRRSNFMDLTSPAGFLYLVP